MGFYTSLLQGVAVVDHDQDLAFRVISAFRIEIIGHIHSGDAFAACIADQLIQQSGVFGCELEGRKIDTLSFSKIVNR